MANLALLFIAVVWLAYSNGANDNYKGVATLFGTGTSNYEGALRWATITTFAGSLTSVFLAETLVKNFSGKGLVPDTLVSDPSFLLAVGIGAAATVFLATLIGIPISTTHSLIGALVGTGLAAAYWGGFPDGILGSVNLTALRKNFLIPLIASPFIAVALTMLFYPLLRRARLGLKIDKETCLCVEEGESLSSPDCVPEPGLATVAMPGTVAAPRVFVGTNSACREGQTEERYQGKLIGIDAQTILDRLHYVSAGAVSFARGLNDTPKVVSLLVAAKMLAVSYGLAIVGFAITIGGWLSARKVAETMSHDITRMNHGQGFTANLVTAVLVIFASRWGVPVSTTHVSCGSLFGIGLVGRELRWGVVSGILLAWVATLPLAALCAGAVFALLQAVPLF